MKLITWTIVFLFVSCQSIHKQDGIQDLYDLNTYYSIYSKENEYSSIISFKSGEDTIHLLKSKNNVIEYKEKILVSEETILKIKDVVKFQLKIENFYLSSSNTSHGNKYVFYIEFSNNKLEAKYTGVDTYKDVSPKFDSLVNYLKIKDIRFVKFYDHN